MSNRAHDWLVQSAHDLQHARHAVEDGDYDWACFAAHQAAEKAVKGLLLSLGGEGWGHAISRLLVDLSRELSLPDGLLSAAQRLDKHYIPTRYPNGFDVGAPRDYYTVGEARQAIQDAERIHDFCQQSLH
ncbi:MAG TPA: HEPN domain-containing protein [Anaerolineae bacterium]|nr:HEPN domain-containing protein [Anaerolineae bacterium]